MFFLLMQSSEAGGQDQFIHLLAIIVIVSTIMYLVAIRPYRKEEQKRREMLKAIKKGDEVMTTAGIFGKVMSIKEDRITLKVDESTNAKMTFLRSAITNLIAEEKSDEKKPEK